MPVLLCKNGKWRIGTGPCIYKSKKNAEIAYAAYRAKKHMAMSQIDWEVLSESAKSITGAGMPLDVERDIFSQSFASV